ncbi:MAG: beta-ACP synthase, partial [Anaerolineales bacterium]|nr:beta-ACP synthase [Anaerolineales bacterium]
DRDGFVMAEGAGVVVLEEYEHARKRGATVLAEVLGYGMTADGTHMTAPDPEGRGAGRAMSAALRDARIDPGRIDYINAHGTSTPLNDRSETAALKKVFAERIYDIPVSSTKSLHGHLLGSTSAVEAVISLKAMGEGVIPATHNYEHPDPDCDLDYVANSPRQQSFNTFMSNGFGFGGHNAVVVMGKYSG